MRKKRRKSLLLVRIGYRGTELDSAPKGNKTFLSAGLPTEFEQGPSGNSRPPRMTTGESFTNALTETRRVVPSLPLADPTIEADTIKRADGSLEWHGARVCRLILFFAFHHPESRPPAPICPKCEQPCAIMFGHSHRASKSKITDIPVKEVDAAPLSSIEMSVRTRNLCASLGIRTIGQLRKRRDNVIQHDRATESSRAEIDRWLSLGRPAKRHMTMRMNPTPIDPLRCIQHQPRLGCRVRYHA